jgi:hypothetical protein
MFSKSMVFSAFSLACLFVATSWCLGGELIAPTRGLGGAMETPGKLIVVSEPPGLEVYLDESHIGETPLLLKDVKPGLHKLRVKQEETDIFVEPGGTFRISLFKGSFVNIPKPEKVEVKQPESLQKQPTGTKRTVVYPNEEMSKDLTSWDMFVNGSLPFF